MIFSQFLQQLAKCGHVNASTLIFFTIIILHDMHLLKSNRQSRQRLDRHGTIVVGSCETFHHYNVQGVK